MCGGIVGVDLECPPGELERLCFAPSFERDARQADHRDGVARVGLGDLPVECLGSIQQPDR